MRAVGQGPRRRVLKRCVVRRTRWQVTSCCLWVQHWFCRVGTQPKDSLLPVTAVADLSRCAVVPLQPILFKPGGLNFNMQQTAARTREGLAKISLPFKLPGGSSGDGQS